MLKKSESVLENVNKILTKTQIYSASSKLDRLDLEMFDGWKDRFLKAKENLKQNINENSSKEMSWLGVVFLAIISIIGFSILLAFVIVFLRIKKAIKYKRIL